MMAERSAMMRLVTWNANMAVHRKLEALRSLKPDIAVVPECASPQAPASAAIYRGATSFAWAGSVPNKGLAVLSFGDYRVTALPQGVGQFAIALLVEGPVCFRLLAIWTQLPKYVEQAHRILDGQADFLARSEPLVVAGDFNSNGVFDRRGARHTHSALVSRLEAFGLFSGYHAHHGEDQGCESRPTFYMYRRSDKPFHLDYVFLPNAWRSAVRDVAVGDYERWEKHSDHMPVMVDIVHDGAGYGG